jgi:hypothetical protein
MARFAYAQQAALAKNTEMQERVRQAMLDARGIRCQSAVWRQ